MFSKEINNTKIPPNFLNTILTNKSVYEMFKYDYLNNIDYFQNRQKEEYLDAILSLFENKLFEDNKLEDYNIKAIKLFFDDFLNNKFKEDKTNIFKTLLFRGLNYHLTKDYSKEYKELYDYIFKESNYMEIKNEIINPIIDNMMDNLSISDYFILTNYIKNNIDGFIDYDLYSKVLYLHVFKTNHVFDKDVVLMLINSLVLDITDLNIKIEIDEDDIDVKNNTIHISNKLIEMFIFGNYVELICELYYQIDLIKDYNNLKNNKIDYSTLQTIQNMVVCGVNLDKIFEDDKYTKDTYFNDMKASAFVKTLRLFDEIGVNLFDSFIKSNTSKLDLDIEAEGVILEKEISLDIKFKKSLTKSNLKYISKYDVLNFLFLEDGTRKSALELIKLSYKDSDLFDFVDEYLSTRIIEPEEIIKDINELGNYKTKDENTNHLIEKLVKYILVDTFRYSVDNYMKLYDKDTDYLDELVVKIKMIKDNPLTHNFIDNSLFEIEELTN